MGETLWGNLGRTHEHKTQDDKISLCDKTISHQCTQSTHWRLRPAKNPHFTHNALGPLFIHIFFKQLHACCHRSRKQLKSPNHRILDARPLCLLQAICWSSMAVISKSKGMQRQQNFWKTQMFLLTTSFIKLFVCILRFPAIKSMDGFSLLAFRDNHEIYTTSEAANAHVEWTKISQNQSNRSDVIPHSFLSGRIRIVKAPHRRRRATTTTTTRSVTRTKKHHKNRNNGNKLWSAESVCEFPISKNKSRSSEAQGFLSKPQGGTWPISHPQMQKRPGQTDSLGGWLLLLSKFMKASESNHPT